MGARIRDDLQAVRNIGGTGSASEHQRERNDGRQAPDGHLHHSERA
jgi:hypothetical protein